MTTIAPYLHILAAILIAIGVWFLLVGTVGLLRLPDFFSRVHAIGKCDTLGAMLMLGGLALHYFALHGFARESLNALKIIVVVLFIFLANPTVTHALSRAALRSGLRPWTKREGAADEGKEEIPPERTWRAIPDAEADA